MVAFDAWVSVGGENFLNICSIEEARNCCNPD